MGSKAKKAFALVAAKKVFDQIQERRRPPQRKSSWGRVVPLVAAVAATGGLVYLAKSGRLQPFAQKVQPVVGKVKDRAVPGRSESSGSTYRPEAHPVGSPVT